MPRRPVALRTAALLSLGVFGVLAACDSATAPSDAGSAVSTTTTAPPSPAVTTTTTLPVTSTTEPPPCGLRSSRPITAQYVERPGVSHQLLSLDAYLLDPACGPRPVVIWIHGGGWREGDKHSEIEGKVAFAAQNAWVLVSVNYRLSTDDVNVRWPDHGNDVAAAIAYVIDHAVEWNIDPTRLALMGHSAGGHIASMLAVDPYLLTGVGHRREEVRCVVALDTQGYDLTAPADENDGWVPFYVHGAFGQTRAALEQASPTWVLRMVPGRIASFLVVTRGGPVRRQIAAEFAALVLANDSEALVLDAGSYGHAQVNEILGDPTDEVVTPVATRFLRRCLG